MTEKKWASSLDVSEETILFRESIGKGSFGEVWSAVWCGSQVAAKTIHEKYFKKEYDQEIRDFYIGKLRNEWKVLQKLVHPNIVRMYTVLFPPHNSPIIVMELMHCDLLHYIENSTSTPKVCTTKGISIALGIAEGLVYLHGQNPDPVVHRDIATKNILLTVDGHPKIADLGVARVFAAGKDDFATARPGTPLYAAPETYKKVSRDDQTAKYGPKVDIFSFGVVVLVMNIGHEPVYLPITRPKAPKLSEVKKREKDIQQIEDPRIQQLVIHCLQEKGSNRPNASKIVTELRRIKDELQGQKVQCHQAVIFEKVSPQLSYDFTFKVLFLGNRNVGKSCLFELLKNPAYKILETMPLTMSIFPIIQWFQYNSFFVKMEIADTSGEERFFALTANYYRDVDGVFLTYDVSNDESFAKLPFWINNLKQYNRKDNIQMVLVGNKLDLRQTMNPDEMVRKGRAFAFANMLGCPYVETSATCIDSVMAMYKKMVDILITANHADVRIQMEEEKPEKTQSTLNLFTQSKRKVWNNVKCPSLSCKNS